MIHAEQCQGVRLDLSNDWSLNCTNAQQQPEAKIEFNRGSIVPQEGGNISTCVPPRYIFARISVGVYLILDDGL